MGELPFKTVRQSLMLMAQTSEFQAKTVLLMLRDKAVISQGVFDKSGGYQTPGWFNEQLKRISCALVKVSAAGAAEVSVVEGVARVWRRLNQWV